VTSLPVFTTSVISISPRSKSATDICSPREPDRISLIYLTARTSAFNSFASEATAVDQSASILFKYSGV